MTQIPCNYAIIRFRPYVETEEFANVGVILLSADERFFDFKLLKRKYSRITRFFHEMDSATFRFSMKLLEDELVRVRGLLKSYAFDRRRKYTEDHRSLAREILREVTKSRETTVTFSEMRAVLANDPKEKLNDLFAYYVERNFVTKKYRETQLENNLRVMLKRARVLDRYERRILGDEEFQVTMPFVEQEVNSPKILKPINLSQETSTKIIDHGAIWQHRLNELKVRGVLQLNKVLFTTEAPVSDRHGNRYIAYRKSCERLEEVGATVVPLREEDRIIEFATTS